MAKNPDFKDERLVGTQNTFLSPFTPGLDPGAHVFQPVLIWKQGFGGGAWMPGSSPGKT
jgi:hypothetical protein